MLIWVAYGYSMSFGNDYSSDFLKQFISNFDKAFLAGVGADSTAATFSEGGDPEYVFVCFQMTFAAITVALVLGSVVERMSSRR